MGAHNFFIVTELGESVKVSGMQFQNPLPFLWRRTRAFLQDFLLAVNQNELGMRAAALAYYALFSLFPLILLIISGIGFVLRDTALEERVMAHIAELLPTQGHVVGTVIQQVVAARGATGVLGMLTLLWSASSFFGALEASINHIAGVEAKRSWWRRRAIGSIMAILMVPLLTLATILSSLSSTLAHYLTFLPERILGLLTMGMNQLVTLALIVVVFTALYHWVPARRPTLPATLVGAMVAAVVWVGLTYLFTWYLGSGLATYNLIYGPIATVIALVLWLYFTSAIILAGATLATLLTPSRPKSTTPPVTKADLFFP